MTDRPFAGPSVRLDPNARRRRRRNLVEVRAAAGAERSDAEQVLLAAGDVAENARAKLAVDLAAAPPRLDDARGLELGEMPADERLAEADELDQLTDRGRARGHALDHAQAVHVGEGLVEVAQLAQILGLIDDRGDGGADVRR